MRDGWRQLGFRLEEFLIVSKLVSGCLCFLEVVEAEDTEGLLHLSELRDVVRSERMGAEEDKAGNCGDERDEANETERLCCVSMEVVRCSYESVALVKGDGRQFI